MRSPVLRSRWWKSALGCLPLLALISAWPVPAEAHQLPTIYVSVAVDEEEVAWKLMVLSGLCDHWFGLEAREIEALEGEDREAANARIERLFGEWSRVTIDGVDVRGVLQSVEFMSFVDHSMTWEYAQVTMAFGAKGRPRQLSLVWKNYDGGINGWFDRIESEIDAFGETSYYVFRDKEPEIIWHAPRGSRVSLARRPPVVEGPPHVRIPVASWAVLVLLLLAVPLLAIRKTPRRDAWIVVVSGFALALGLSGVAHTEIELPFGPRFQRPTPEKAAYTFETLLRNVYRAFDYDAEDTVYDTLAETVDGDLLRDLYLEVYGSLILEEEGGAVCKVQRVEILDQTVVFPDEEHAPWYSVLCRWRVHGKVGHWGHTHTRINEYEALFRVGLQGDRWKVQSMRVVEKERVEDLEKEWR